MQIGGEGYRNFTHESNVSQKKKPLKKTQIYKDIFLCLFLLGNGLKKFQFETLHMKT
jgi:hypothetical protein